MGFKQKGEKLYENLYILVRRKSAIRRRIREFRKKTPGSELSVKEKNVVKEFYTPYKIPDLVFHEFFTQNTGKFHAEYIPIDLYVGYIDPYFNDIREAKYIDNKCYFDALFYSIPQPKTIAKRVNGMWMNGNNAVIQFEQVAELIFDEDGVFLKEAQTSAGGHGVTFIPNSKDALSRIKKIADNTPTDLLIQRRILQHESMSAVNPSSVNTLRIYSILGLDGCVTIYSAVLRAGVGDTKVDNYSAGGLSIGIDDKGKLRKFGYTKNGKRLESHPTTGLVFDGYELPSFDRACSLVKQAHLLVPHFRSVSWDIAIGLDSTPILIEGNLCRGGIDLLQLSNGPLYGKDTKKILDEVFGK